MRFATSSSITSVAPSPPSRWSACWKRDTSACPVSCSRTAARTAPLPLPAPPTLFARFGNLLGLLFGVLLAATAFAATRKPFLAEARG